VWVCSIFFKGYLEVAAEVGFLPQTREELQVLLDIYVLEREIREVSYELNNRPNWVRIPLQGIKQVLQTSI